MFRAQRERERCFEEPSTLMGAIPSLTNTHVALAALFGLLAQERHATMEA